LGGAQPASLRQIIDPEIDELNLVCGQRLSGKEPFEGLFGRFPVQCGARGASEARGRGGRASGQQFGKPPSIRDQRWLLSWHIVKETRISAITIRNQEHTMQRRQ
jgi:hypothetical protein